MRSSLLALGLLVASVLASPVSHHVVHEKREAAPANWRRAARLNAEAVLPLRIALTQQNLHRGADFLMDVADPTSPNFGKHWSARKIAETFAPAPETAAAVKTWLVDAGIAADRLALSQSLNWLQLNATVEEAERLLQAEYHVYQHEDGTPHVACESYSVPAHVSQHVDFITPTVHFDAKVLPSRPDPGRDDELEKRAGVLKSALRVKVQPGKAAHIGAPTSGSLPKQGASHIALAASREDQLANCDSQITPACLRALYQLPNGTSANPRNSYGIVEYSPQAYRQPDLDLFFANFSKALVGKPPILDSIDGGVAQTSQTGFQYNGESNLDLEYAMSLVYPVNVTVFQTGDPIASASFNNFLDAIDGAYCTYEGGDDSSQDVSYPDSATGGYKGPNNCGGFAATKVISTSYGYNEADLTAAYEQRQCNEYMKLGLQGVTFLFSSGDYGVAGNGGQCIDANTRQFNSGGSGMFNPSFPPTCPYVTAVGATQVAPGNAVTAPETACEKVIYSGGGFSNVFPMPSYQSAAVESWFRTSPPAYGSDVFNNSGTVRAYPDVAANGANYAVAIEGNFSLVYGTSASSPTFGSVITLINEARLNKDKSTVGFINPTLYQNPGVMFDITSGGNQGCGTAGFTAVQGWDPVTGLGTPNYPKLLDLYLSLP
ncbi:MAG: hypothetical protein M1838_004413 [Thelocarpon superellum]|nr:MAG: hypothetical protein M1838_004413 [Thelocarpon superellum]